MSNKIYYKVVVDINNKKKSSACHYIDDIDGADYSVTYIPGEFVTPVVKNTKLFVFNTKADALNFARYGYYEIWECEVKNPAKCNWLANMTNIVSFWKNKKNHKSIYFYSKNAPTGTRTCDAVKLLRKVYP